MTEDTPQPQPSEVAPGSSAPNPARWSLVLAWSVVVSLGGGYACALAISRYGELGSVSIWLTGAAAGFVGRRLLLRPHRLAGWILACACVAAFVVAEVCWIHWKWQHGQGTETLWGAVKLLPDFVNDYGVAALAGAIFTAFGASSAYRQAGARYVQVRVE